MAKRTKSEKLHNISVITICLTMLYVLGRACQNEYAFVSVHDRTDTQHQDLRTFHCCRPHKLAIKASCTTRYFYTFDNDMLAQRHTQRMHCWLSTAIVIPQTFVILTLPTFFKLRSRFNWLGKCSDIQLLLKVILPVTKHMTRLLLTLYYTTSVEPIRFLQTQMSKHYSWYSNVLNFHYSCLV